MTTKEKSGIHDISALMNSAYNMGSSFTTVHMINSLKEKGLHKNREEVGLWLDRLVTSGVLLKVNNFYSVI